MESEFKDSIYVLASRLGENKPMPNRLAVRIVYVIGAAHQAAAWLLVYCWQFT